MHNLFEITTNSENETSININPIVLSIKEFAKIWNRDRSKWKEKARKELTYIYGMSSPEDDNIWKDYTNLNERSNIIIADIWGDELAWTPDRLVEEALVKYRKRIPKDATELLLETLLSSMMKIREHINTIDYNAINEQNGSLLHKPKDTLVLAKEALKQYMEIEDAIGKIKAKKKLTDDKIKGGGQEGLFEGGNVMDKLI